jgi:hypothetical protein
MGLSKRTQGPIYDGIPEIVRQFVQFCQKESLKQRVHLELESQTAGDEPTVSCLTEIGFA